MPAAAALPFISAGIGAGGSLLGGVKGSSAASQAAAIQARAAQQAMVGVNQALNQWNPGIMTQAQQASANALAAAQTGGAGVTQAAQTATGGITNAAQAANALLNPYIQTGTAANQQLATMLAPGGSLMQPFTMQTMQQMDPGYQFRIDEANKALQGSAAARGGALGGGTAAALGAQTQNLASSEYENAFNRYLAQNQQQFNFLNTLGGQGLTAGTTAGGNLFGAAQLGGGWGTAAAQQAANLLTGGTQYGGTITTNAAQQQAANAMAAQQAIANLITGGAAAQAGGVVGSANAWNNAFGGIANAAGGAANAYQQNQLLNVLKSWRPSVST